MRDGQRPGAGYTFGDTDVAARRLAVVHQVFGPASRTLLADAVTRPPALAYDLGCGPGHTTALVAQVTQATRTIGLDSSAAHVARARARAAGRVEFAVHDVLELPLPAGPADLIYCRLLLAHLNDPAACVRRWASQLTSDGLVVVDEIEWIATSHPLLRAHLLLAESLVATTGARMCAGPLLAGLASDRGLRRPLDRVAELPVPTALAATMFSMNIAAWGDRPVALGLSAAAALTDLAAGMTELTRSPAVGEISWGLHQTAYARRH